LIAVRAPALPAQSNPGGRFRKGGEAPLRGGRSEVGGEEATANIAVLEAIVESAETGRAVAVGEK
jgi:predicted dehydrogenase